MFTSASYLPSTFQLQPTHIPSNRSMASDSYPASPNHPSTQASSTAHPADHHTRDHLSAAAQTQSLDRGLRPANQPPGAGGAAPTGRHVASLGRTPSGHGVQAGGDPTVNGPRQQSVKDYRAAHGFVFCVLLIDLF